MFGYTENDPPPSGEAKISFFAVAGGGLVATALASAINFGLAQAGFEIWMSGEMAQHGASESTGISLGFYVTEKVFYPALLGFYLVLAIPILCKLFPEMVRQNAFLVGCPLFAAALTGLFWFWAGGPFWFYTLPAVICAAAASLGVALLARALGSPG